MWVRKSFVSRGGVALSCMLFASPTKLCVKKSGVNRGTWHVVATKSIWCTCFFRQEARKTYVINHSSFYARVPSIFAYMCSAWPRQSGTKKPGLDRSIWRVSPVNPSFLRLVSAVQYWNSRHLPSQMIENPFFLRVHDAGQKFKHSKRNPRSIGARGGEILPKNTFREKCLRT